MKTASAIVLFLTVLFSTTLFAGTASQTDWAGGDGILGPVTAWGDQFYSSTDIEYMANPLNITLQGVVLENCVDSLSGSTAVFSADYNDDNYTDLLGVAFYEDGIYWWKNDDGSGTSWTKGTIGSGLSYPVSVFSADVNNDGHMDAMAASSGGYGKIVWWENDGSGETWTERVVDDSFSGAYSVFSEDIDDDGDQDILGAAYYDNDITWWENTNGLGTNWVEHTIDGSFAGAQGVFAADMNDDGYMDVIGAGYTANDVTWWENTDGTGTIWVEHTIDVDFSGARSVYCSDVNADGYMDVVGAAYVGSEIAWWENTDGSGTSWVKHTVCSPFNNPMSVCSKDVNGDGYMDILGAAYSGNQITWWENNDGSGTSFTEHVLNDSFGGAYSVYSDDVNGDGNLDVIGVSHFNGDFTWWNLSTYLLDGSLESSILDAQENPAWQSIDWTCTEPSGTSLTFQVRASSDSLSMGDWSAPLTDPASLIGVIDDEDQYFQYRALLSTSEPNYSAVLEDVTIEWVVYNGIEEGPGLEVNLLQFIVVTPNPSYGSAEVKFAVAQNISASIDIYDVSGRILRTSCEDYNPGEYSLVLDELQPGLYFVRMQSSGVSLVSRFVVL